MPNLGFTELFIVLIIALVIFGPSKLPSLGKSLGQAIREFRNGAKEITSDDKEKIGQG